MRLPGGVFYGWAIALFASVIAFSSGPGQSFVFSVFVDPIIEETGFSRSAVSTLYAAGSGISAVMVSLVSRMADRFGPRRVLLFVGSALGAVCLLLATAHAMLVFLFAFAALRALGQGSLPVNGTLLIAQWFSRYRARAVAVMSLGFAVATAVLPPASRLVIESYGWREAYAVLGVMVWLLILPGSFFLIRDTPEQVGLLPDGEEVPSGRHVEASTVSGPDNRRVFTSTTFWALALPLATPSLVVTAMVFHQTGIFEERGLSATTAGAVFVPFAISSAVSAVAGGFLIDRYGPRPVFVGAMVLLLAALAWLQFVDSVPEALLYATILGASGALAQTIGGVIWAHFYGRERLGRIQGSGMMVGIAGAALGPLPLALLESVFDGFGPGLLALSVLPVIAIVVILLARPVGTAIPQEA
jgi:MFS family permease